MGDASLLVQCGNELLRRGHDISAVVGSSPDVSRWASDRALFRLESEDVIRDGLPEIDFHWFFSITNLRMLPTRVWQAASKGAVNFHDGPLPRHAGLNAPAWAILKGETDYGITWHALSEHADEGDIYLQSNFDISNDDTSLTLNLKCFDAGLTSFGQLLDAIESGSLVRKPQDLTKRTYHARHDRPRNGATIDFLQPVEDIGRLARATHFGENYRNPIGLPKLRTQKATYTVLSLDISNDTPSAAPATVIAIDEGTARIAAADGVIRINAMADAFGAPVAPSDVLQAGEVLPSLDPSTVASLDRITPVIARNERFFLERLQHFRDLEIYGLGKPAEGDAARWQTRDFSLPATLEKESAIAAVIAGLSRIAGQPRVDVLFSDDSIMDRVPGYVADVTPLSITIENTATAEALSAVVTEQVSDMRRRVGFATDLISRIPELTVLRSAIAISLSDASSSVEPCRASAITFAVPTTGRSARFFFNENCIATADAEALLRRIEIFIEAFSADRDVPVASLPIMSNVERETLLYGRNATALDYDRTALVHNLFERQAAATPDAIALVCGDESLTYRELDMRANRVAQYLQSLGVNADTLVGLNLRRSSELVIGALAILKAGGAYVPLDPKYPADRLSYMIEDSGLTILLVEPDALSSVTIPGVRPITISIALAAAPEAKPLASQTSNTGLAYAIYTSGSTGRPKGVMIEHRNVVNFFAGMNQRIPIPENSQPVWLAVTSLSFDISVLELFWTLSHGFKVVILQDDKDALQPATAARSSAMEFGLFYWGDDDTPGAGKYQLLLDGAKFADQHGFNAVWTPERHFHAFGGPYPNPSVTGAAVAAVTKNVSIRAGSCVLPLHHPVRVAEEWAVVDNISNGRVALAFASGWMPEDFLLRPENAPPANKSAMLRDIDTVRKLWRGDKITFPSSDGTCVEVVTQPRPVQATLPFWITTAGNVDTFIEAARHGANVLTHLLGQSIEEVAEKIAAYRNELRRLGRDPSQYKVSLMLHTLIGRDRDVVREQAREPMKRYLKSAAGLIKNYAWAFPAFRKPQGVQRAVDLDLRSVSDEEMDAVVDFAFLRYFDDSGLFGTVEDAIARVNQLTTIGVDEIACLVDFGVERDAALNALVPLAEVVAAIKAQKPASIPTVIGEAQSTERAGALMLKHGVTHLQCTPAMATMFLENEEDRAGLHSVKHLFIGGEALQGSLLKRLRQVTDASVENMYGPTETTIWSSTGPANDTDGNVPLGTPIANTQLYVLDQDLRPMPQGLPGELFIGGDGVARGYHNRPDLTAERFLADPFVPGGRMYRTGDLVRIGADGEIHFIGRTDHQVKVRGYRIELGEIENCIALLPDVGQAVVIVREDTPGDARIVAYLKFKDKPISDDELRAHIRKSLPEFMVPAHFIVLDQFPLTPNLKVDRKALPKPGGKTAISADRVYVAPATDLEKRIADVFKDVLGVDRIGLNDSFFSLGGHSLLAVQAHRVIKAQVAPEISITDLYRFPTVSGLVGHLGNADRVNRHLDLVAARAAERRAALAMRRGGGARTHG